MSPSSMPALLPFMADNKPRRHTSSEFGGSDASLGAFANPNLGFLGEGLQPFSEIAPEINADGFYTNSYESEEVMCDCNAEVSIDVIPPKEEEKRTVHWVDDCGEDIAQVREFEPSDSGDSDEDEDTESSQACNCVIQ